MGGEIKRIAQPGATITIAGDPEYIRQIIEDFNNGKIEIEGLELKPGETRVTLPNGRPSSPLKKST